MKLLKAFGMAVMILACLGLFLALTFVLAKISIAYPVVGWCMGGVGILVFMTKMCYDFLYPFGSSK